MKAIQKKLLRLWLVIWVITLPLIHIHPEVDHAHGMSGHVHGGTYHSILVNTPVHAHQGYDQEKHHHDGFFFVGDGFESTQAPLHASHGFEETTYDFSIIKPSIILESEKSEVPHDVVVPDRVEPWSLTGIATLNVTPKKRRFSILPSTLSARAPPVLLI
ncbi:MAG: hypothetical protein ACQ9IQ_01250 [Nitrospirales bacterium]